LVERQLCKLEVRGSNPLASIPESFRECRAAAAAKAAFEFAECRFEILKMRACVPVFPNRRSTVANLKSGGFAAFPGL
jgi:hypothetical protein